MVHFNMNGCILSFKMFNGSNYSGFIICDFCRHKKNQQYAIKSNCVIKKFFSSVNLENEIVRLLQNRGIYSYPFEDFNFENNLFFLMCQLKHPVIANYETKKHQYFSIVLLPTNLVIVDHAVYY
jgi:hypothetical protein